MKIKTGAPKSIIKSYFLLIIIILLNIFSCTALAKKNKNSEYTVGNIDVVVKASSAAKAKEIAIKRAKRKALFRLIDLLLTDINSLPKDEIKDREIESTVLDISISSEQFGNKKYKGIFIVRFSKDLLGSLLNSHGVNPEYINDTALTRLSSMLVIPILQIEDNAYIWDETNSWKLYWDKNYGKIFSPIINITLPTGDLSDITIANSDKILNKDTNAFNLLMNKYLSDGLLITHIRNISGEKKLFLTFFDGLNYYQLSHPYIDESLNDIEFFQKALLESIKSVELFLSKKQKDSRKSTLDQQIEIILDVNNINDFNKFKDILNTINGIKSLEIKELNKFGAIFNVKANNNIESIISELKDYNFNIEHSHIDANKLFITNNSRF